MKAVLPCRGEFGLKIRFHVPAVHALPGPKVVYMEPGEECFYPSASEWREVPRLADDIKAGTHPRGDAAYIRRVREKLHAEGFQEVIQTRKGMPEARFIPKPFKPQGVTGTRVVICPRGRAYGSSKNYPHWEYLVRSLPGPLFLAGAPDSSLDFDMVKSWDFPRLNDSTIEAMRQAQLVIATDSGGAHLAVLCGAPLLMITYGGLIAPGPVIDSSGRLAHKKYWPVRFEEYYQKANHLKSPIWMTGDWDDPHGVLTLALTILEETPMWSEPWRKSP